MHRRLLRPAQHRKTQQTTAEASPAEKSPAYNFNEDEEDFKADQEEEEEEAIRVPG